MKKSRIIIAAALLGMTFTSCKKDYVCTCTTVVSAVSADVKHDIKSASYSAAVESCNNYQEQANSTLPGGTTCHL